MISSYSLLATTLAVIASCTTRPVASSFVSNQLIGDHIVKRTLEGGDNSLSFACTSESVSVQMRLVAEALKGNDSYSCKDAGGKVFKLEFEGTCSGIKAGVSSGDPNCVGTSCTIEEFQTNTNANTAGDSSYDGCSNYKWCNEDGRCSDSSGAFSLGTASGTCVMAGLLLSTIALLN
jgi:hypothetical protein